eukprot:Skav214056  [mRNA]  locus=scaffold2017:511895:521001:+ [translate_table: standard]
MFAPATPAATVVLTHKLAVRSRLEANGSWSPTCCTELALGQAPESLRQPLLGGSVPGLPESLIPSVILQPKDDGFDVRRPSPSRSASSPAVDSVNRLAAAAQNTPLLGGPSGVAFPAVVRCPKYLESSVKVTSWVKCEGHQLGQVRRYR